MGQVNTPSNLIDRIRVLERQLAEVRKRVGLGNAVISAGDITIQDGGTFRLRHPNGTVIARIGNLGLINGEDVWGVQFKRPDGSEALIVYGTDSGASTYSAFKDKAGHLILSDDSVSGQGLATPHLAYPVPVAIGVGHWPSGGSSSFSTIASTSVKVTHPRISIFGSVDRDSGITGRARVMLNGTQIGPTTTAPGDFEFTAAVPGWGSSVSFQDELLLQIQVIRDSGTSGQVYATLWNAYGVQS